MKNFNQERNFNNRPLIYVEAEGEEEEEAVLTPETILLGRDVYAVEDNEGLDAEKLAKMAKRIGKCLGKYMETLESHRLNTKSSTIPQVGEIVLISGDGTNPGEGRKGNVVRLIKGNDDVVRGVALLYKGHTIDQPLQLVCPLEIRAVENVDQPQNGRRDDVGEQKRRRGAAQMATQRITEQLQEEEN